MENVEITLSLSHLLIQQVKRFSIATQQDIEVILADSLEMIWPVLAESSNIGMYPPVSTLSDDEVLTLANTKMDETQNKRLGDLQQRGKTKCLSEAEQYELSALLQIYQIGQIRKSQGLAEAVQRGLRPPMSP